MKDFVFSLVLFASISCSFTGCGGTADNKVVEPAEASTITAENMSAYEEQMKKGGSARPGN